MRDEYIKDLLESNQIVSRMVVSGKNYGEILFLSCYATEDNP